MTDIRRFDLNLLLAFDALMSERSVTKAAARLGVGQPAMSYSLSQLRSQLDDELFVRSGGLMLPTARAMELAEPIGRILADIRNSVLSRSAFDPSQEARVFRIGASDQVQTALIPQLLADFRVNAPNIQLVFRTLERDATAAALEAGIADIAIGPYDGASPAQRRDYLYTDELVCIFDGAACRLQAPISLDDYCRMPHLIVSNPGELRDEIDEKLRASGKERFVAMTTQNYLVLPYVLHRTVAIAVVPKLLARYCADAAGLAVSALPVPSPSYGISMLWHVRMDRDPGHQWLRERLKLAVEQKPNGEPR